MGKDAELDRNGRGLYDKRNLKMYLAVKSYYTITASALQNEDLNNAVYPGVRLNILVEDISDLTPGLLVAINGLSNDHMISLGASFFRSESEIDKALPRLFLAITINDSPTGQTILPVFGNVDKQRLGVVQAYFSGQGVASFQLAAFDITGPGFYHSPICSLFITSAWAYDPVAVAGFVSRNGELSIIASAGNDGHLQEIAEFRKLLARNSNEILNACDVDRILVSKELEKEVELWRKRAELYHDFVPLSKKVQEKEYNDVVAWYHKEYEVLPVWYKRFGHIIKVLMGKRKLRSLFGEKLKQKKT